MPPKVSSSKTSRRRRAPEFGAPSVDDLPTTQLNQPSSTALSTRAIHDPDAPLQSLTTLAAQVFAQNFKRLTSGRNLERTLRQLKTLPDILVPKVFSLVKQFYPNLLSHSVISANFLRGSSVSLDDTVEVKKETLSAIHRFMKGSLKSLRINDVSGPLDRDFAGMIGNLPNLELLNLRGCTKVSTLTVNAIAQTCKALKSINLGSTATPVTPLGQLVLERENLEVLKIAGIHNFTDATGAKFLHDILSDESRRPLSSLVALNVRYNSISEATVIPLLKKCVDTIKRVDVSFTLVTGKLWSSLQSPCLEKVSLTSTLVIDTHLLQLLHYAPNLRILNIGALGSRSHSSTSLQLDSQLTLNDEMLRKLTEALEHCPNIENVNLVQNAKLGLDYMPDRALAGFIQRIGRKCKVLNLTGLSRLRSSDLEGFVSNDVDSVPCRIQSLYLNKTGVGDEAALWIAACRSIEVLEVAETRFSSDGLFTIIDECPKLRALNLTGCRGVKVTDRRKFFEVWKERD